ncbi:MAG: lamin tail domain-containing protein [Candidatus Omnitrophica bacterium]|nr:lamin tail domain-containing protein [Candidatus Omnitrophota bacterium]
MKETIRFFLQMVLFLCASYGRLEAAVVINEFLADPPAGLVGDANRDGVRSASDDEFVELINAGGSPMNLSSWSLWDSLSLRHRFPDGTALAPLQRLVVFGGGNPAGFTGLVQTASTGSLSLNNGSDRIFLRDSADAVADQLAYLSEADRDQSLTRFPEGSGIFTLHTLISARPFSPGGPAGGSETGRTPVPEPITAALVGAGLLCLINKRSVDRAG